MSRPTLSTTDNLFDFFHEEVDAVVHRRRVPVSEDGVYYLTALLVERGRQAEAPTPATLAELHIEARLRGAREAFTAYRELGDRAMMQSGFFRESLARSVVSIDYVRDMGAAAYAALSQMNANPSGGLERVFEELAEAFEPCSEALSEVRDELRPRTDTDIVKLYEEWLSTGSQRVAERLKALGVLPMRPTETTEE